MRKDYMVARLVQLGQRRRFLRYPILAIIAVVLASYHFARFLFSKRRTWAWGTACSLLMFTLYHTNLMASYAGDGTSYKNPNQHVMLHAMAETVEQEEAVLETDVFPEEDYATDEFLDDLEEVETEAEAIAEETIEETAETVIEPDWRLILVNRSHAVPEDYEFEKKYYNGMAVDERIYDDLAAMLEAGRKEGCVFVVCSAYRSIERQQERYQENVAKYRRMGYSYEEACKQTERTLSVPEYSEHHTGLAVDIVSKAYQMLNEGYANTKEAIWLAAHAHEYGFIVRYPMDKAEITGIDYEPWHFRYVGVEAATEIREQGICLEEYLVMHGPEFLILDEQQGICLEKYLEQK